MKKTIITIGLLFVGGLSWFFLTKPEPPFAGKVTPLELARECLKTSSIDNCVVPLDHNEKVKLKSEQISRVGAVERSNVKFSGASVDVQIVSIEQIEGGVQVFARAWDQQGQVGFGVDGTVEVERFRIFNPPILVDDSNGSIVRTSIDDITKEVKTRKLREDPKQAILQTLAHTIVVSSKANPRGKVVTGKIGNTTDTYYPDANPESTSVDGRVDNSGATYSTVRSATAGTSAGDSEADSQNIPKNSFAAGTYFIGRGFYLFDTSALPDTDTITSATLSIYDNSSNKGDTDNESIVIVSSTPASNTGLVTGDFDQIGAVSFASIDITSWVNTGAYNDFTLDASGVANISLSGVSKFATRTSGDLNNSAPTGVNHVRPIWADTAGTSSDPKLVVVHSSASSGKPRRQIIKLDNSNFKFEDIVTV